MQPYPEGFYKDRDSATRESVNEIIRLLLELFRPASVIDLGCGVGTWLAVFQELGIRDVCGVDGEWLDPSSLRIPKDKFISVDLSRPFRVEKKFDLAVSLEVAEHLLPESVASLVDSLCSLAPVVLFSSAIPGQGGINHLNEQWQDYWAKQFSQKGFAAIDCIRRQTWHNEKVLFWYAQNILLFVQNDFLAGHPELKEAADRTDMSQLSIVHPKMQRLMDDRLAGAYDAPNLPIRKTLKALPAALAMAIRRRLKNSSGKS